MRVVSDLAVKRVPLHNSEMALEIGVDYMTEKVVVVVVIVAVVVVDAEVDSENEVRCAEELVKMESNC